MFSIAVLPHSPGVLYHHLLLRQETRIPFSFRIGIWHLFVHRGQQFYTPTAFGKSWTTPGVRCMKHASSKSMTFNTDVRVFHTRVTPPWPGALTAYWKLHLQASIDLNCFKINKIICPQHLDEHRFPCLAFPFPVRCIVLLSTLFIYVTPPPPNEA